MANPTAVIPISPFIRPPVTRPRDKENAATRMNQPLFKDDSPLY